MLCYLVSCFIDIIRKIYRFGEVYMVNMFFVKNVIFSMCCYKLVKRVRMLLKKKWIVIE